MIQGKTSNGFVFEIADDARDDMELLEAFIEMDDGKMSALPRAIKSLLGEDQRKALYEHCRNKETGRVSANGVFTAVKEIMDIASEKSNDVKN